MVKLLASSLAKPRWLAAVALAALWLFVLLVFLQHASPASSSPAAQPAASPGDVVINEVAWMGTSASTTADEWIELYNNTPNPISLAGWTLTTTGSVSFTIPAGKTIPPNGYFLLERAEKAVTDTLADYVYGGAQMNNGGEKINLRDATGALVDTANISGTSWLTGTASPDYKSMERINPLAPDINTNWAANDGITRNGKDANNQPINGTPKQPNSATPADLYIVKSAPDAVLLDHEITYTLMFGNAGGKSASGVMITDTLPMSATFITQTSSYPFTQTDRELVWQIGALSSSLNALSLTLTISMPTGFLGLITNTVIITSEALDYRLDNNAYTVTTQVVPESADVGVSKSAPVSVTAGTEITYLITISNVGQLTAPGVRVTDTLPLSVTFVRQSAPYTMTPDGRGLVWDVGDVLTSDAPISWTVTGLVDLYFAGTMTNLVQAGTATTEPVTVNNSAQAAALVVPPPPVVLINDVLYEGYQSGQDDEAIEIVNAGLLPVNLKGYTVTNRAWSGVRFTGSYTLEANQRVWLTKDADRFRDSFGFWPDFAVTGTLTNGVRSLGGTWPGGSLGDSGDAQVRDAAGNVLDRLVYGGYEIPSSGWLSPTVYHCDVGSEKGQILARVPDERTGLPVPDTDTANDWIQYSGNYTTGRRVMYPGWDMTYPGTGTARLFWPFTTTAPATVTLGIAPDNAFDVVRDAIRSAQRSIEIETYELKNYGVITEVVQKARSGVSVTVLLEGERVDDQERWACQEIETTNNGQCWFMHTYTSAHIYDRYDLIHAKFIILDRQRLVVSTQNPTSGGMPDDDKSNGTFGSRGYVLYIESPELAARAGLILDRDRNPDHTDIARWSLTSPYGFGKPITTNVPITTSDGMTTTVLFPAPQMLTDATQFELFTAPEAALRQSDALLGLLARVQSGDEVYIEQMYEYPDWGDSVAAPNLRLKAYVDAARRGARVRILLNSGMFDQEYIDLAKNITTTAYVNAIAQSEGLDLQARMGDPTRYGIHSKIVLVKLNSQGGLAYSHVGSINGSESSSKVNREMAVQVESQGLYAALRRVFWADWNLAGPTFLPVIMRNYRTVDYVLISEVHYGGPADQEWVEIYNPTGRTIDLSSYKIGDAETRDRYEGMYQFPPGTTITPGGVIVIAYNGAVVPQASFEISGTASAKPDMIKYAAWGSGNWGLGDADQVLLLGPNDVPVDVVVWGSATYPGVVPHPGVSYYANSLERYPANDDSDDCSIDFRDQYLPTPGSVPY